MKDKIELNRNEDEKDNLFEPLIICLKISKNIDNLENKHFCYNPELIEPEPHEIKKQYSKIETVEEKINQENNEEKKEKKYLLIENGKKRENIIHETNILKFDLNCWWCCHKFSNNPLFLPTKFEKNVFWVKGYFCSFSCMITYNKNIKDNKVNERNSLIYLMRKKMYNCQDLEISYALPRETLKIFGGKLTIEEFREKSKNCKSNVNIFYPPMIPIVPKIEESTEIDHIKWKHTSKYFMNEASKTLKLQRNKPLTKKNTLEKYMNIRKTNI